jgi:electron transport complex protein RnfB
VADAMSLIRMLLAGAADRLSTAMVPRLCRRSRTDAGTTPSPAALAERLDALLPQTQCTQCGYQGCAPYARAMAAGEADINQCPPGGQEVVAALARELGIHEKPLNPLHGEHKPPVLARIDEARCIGCRLCIKACPTDAIVGAPRLMHTVIEDDCTGCELCLPPCPVDCIDLLPRPIAASSAPRHAAGPAQPRRALPGSVPLATGLGNARSSAARRR